MKNHNWIFLVAILLLIANSFALITTCGAVPTGTQQLGADITFTFNGACMNLSASGTNFDCNGHFIKGNGGNAQIAIQTAAGASLTNIGNCINITDVAIGVKDNGAYLSTLGGKGAIAGPFNIYNTSVAGVLVTGETGATACNACGFNITNTNIIGGAGIGIDYNGGTPSNQSILNVTISNKGSHGLELLNTNYPSCAGCLVTIQNVQISNVTNDALRADGLRGVINFVNVSFNSSNDRPIWISGTSSGTITFNNITVVGPGNQECIRLGQMGAPTGIIFSNTSIKSCDNGIYIDNNAGTMTFINITINGTNNGIKLASTSGNIFNNVTVYSEIGDYINNSAGGIGTFNGFALSNNNATGWINYTQLVTSGSEEIGQSKQVDIRNDHIAINISGTPILNSPGIITISTDTSCNYHSFMFLNGYYPYAQAMTTNGTYIGVGSCTLGVTNFSATSPLGSYAVKFTPTLNITFSSPTTTDILFNSVNVTNFGNVTNAFLYLDNYPLGLMDMIFNTYQNYQIYNNQSGNFVDTLQVITRNATSGIRTMNSGIGIVQNATVQVYTNASGSWVKYDRQYTNPEGYVYVPILISGTPVKIIVSKDGFTQATVIDKTDNLNVAEYDIKMVSGQYNFNDGYLLMSTYLGGTYDNSTLNNMTYYISSMNPVAITVDTYRDGVIINETNYSSSDTFTFNVNDLNGSNNFTTLITRTDTKEILWNDTRIASPKTTIALLLSVFMDPTVYFLLMIAVVLVAAAGEFFYMKGLEVFFLLCILMAFLNFFFIPQGIMAVLYWMGRSGRPMWSEGS